MTIVNTCIYYIVQGKYGHESSSKVRENESEREAILYHYCKISAPTRSEEHGCPPPSG